MKCTVGGFFLSGIYSFIKTIPSPLSWPVIFHFLYKFEIFVLGKRIPKEKNTTIIETGLSILQNYFDSTYYFQSVALQLYMCSSFEINKLTERIDTYMHRICVTTFCCLANT